MKKPAHFNSSRQKLIFPLVVVAALAACNGGGGGGGGSSIPTAIAESEPNDTTATATAVPVGTPVTGDSSAAADIDYFKVTLTGGRLIEIELCATRESQDTWDTANNVPRLILLDTDGTSKLLEHDYSATVSDGWSWGKHDLDMPLFEVPATGDYFVSVSNDDPLLAGGSYVLRVHYVTVPSLQEELETLAAPGTNDTFGTAETITPGTIHGYHVSGENDFYAFVISGPSTVSFQMTAYRNGVNRGDANYYDPFIYLYDTDGTTLLTSNDDTIFYDSGIQYKFATAGTYFIRVFEFDVANSEYFLSFTRSSGAGSAESEPNDTTATADNISYGGRVTGDIDTALVDYFKFSGTAGDMVRLQRFDIFNFQGAADSVVVTLLAPDGVTALTTGGDGSFQTQTTILQATGTYYIKVEPDGTPVATSYALELTRFNSATYETEPNDAIATAGTLNSNSRVAGVIDPALDADVYHMTLTANHLVSVVCYASSSATDSDGDSEYSGHGSSLAPVLEILDDTGAVVATSTSTPTNVFTESVTDPLPTCAVCGVPDVGGDYFVRVTDAAGAGGPAYYYVLERR